MNNLCESWVSIKPLRHIANFEGKCHLDTKARNPTPSPYPNRLSNHLSNTFPPEDMGLVRDEGHMWFRGQGR